ncbi:MAG: trypsin-like peptidase domain-containing protein, partial [Clostridia bacterium]|nr:trypsin-like peptidase domain-containing protein [Clostridia bacterium]
PLADKGDNQLSSKSAVFNAVDPSVVLITVYTEKGIAGYASGVIYTDDGYIVTNDHIYTKVPSAKFLITTNDGIEYDAAFVAGDTRSDLAVLKVEAVGLKKALFGNSEQVLIGEEVIAIGYASGVSGKSILTSGTISSNNIRFSSTSDYSVKMIQTDTAINPGNSGGALVNMYGQVIGIPSVKMTGTQYDNVSYAIPSNTVVKIVDSLIEHGHVVGRGRLGIHYTEVNSITAKLNNVPTGLMIQEITVESDLYGKGIAVKDIITHINDVEITESGIALDIIESTEPGKVMTFTVYSMADGSTKTYYASLIEDQGNSSYTNTVAEGEDLNNSFGNLNPDDFFSDK